MSRFRFELAGPADDADLRHILAATPMPGRISVRFEREPSWFEGAVVDGFTRQVVACRDSSTGRVVGFGCRSLRELYVNGRPEIVGYLSSLRGSPAYRNLGLLARGYAFFRRLHADGRTPFYLTTIAEGNEPALRILTSGRAALPQYHFAGRYHTLALALPRRRRPLPVDAALTFRSAQAADVPALLDFLKTFGPRRQYFPVYRAENFQTPQGLLRDLDLQHLLLAERPGRIVGAVAAWDQQGYRQHVVQGYSRGLRCARPIYNLAARLRGTAELPSPGQPLRTLSAALPLVEDDDPGTFAALLSALQGHCGGGARSHLLLGLHERDPLLRVARKFQTVCYTTLLYLVCWPDGDGARLAVDERPPYLELGSL